jgi:hypothetical protein
MITDPMFARNIANRLWKHMFNLALVEPVDGMDPARLDPGSPPPEPWELQSTHPQLLERLAAHMASLDYNLREFLRLLASSSAYQLSSRYAGEWKLDYVQLFARHYPRRLEGEEIHDAVTQATGVGASYTIQNYDTVTSAIRLPEPVEPRSDRGAANFMNVFLRGNRDTQTRSQAGSLLQQLALMNDPFVNNRIRMTASPALQALAAMADEEAIDELYLSFLSRPPDEAERARALATLQAARTPAARNAAFEDLAWVSINRLEFIFSH